MPVRRVSPSPQPWNKGLLVGQKASRTEACMVDSGPVRNRRIKARSCNLQSSNRQQAARLRSGQITAGRHLLWVRVRQRATIVPKKTGRPVQFEITEQSRSSVEAWLPMLRATGSRYLFPSRLHASPHISTRQYARLVHRWVESIRLAWSRLFMARTRCGVRRLPRFIARPVTCVQSNFSSAIPSWKALSDISGLRWMTL